MFALSEAFFALPAAQKAAYGWESPESNRGYLALGKERLDGGLPDIKETFEIGNEAEDPRSGIRIHVSQPALERTRVSLCSAVFRCIPLYYCYSLNTRPDTVFPP